MRRPVLLAAVVLGVVYVSYSAGHAAGYVDGSNAVWELVPIEVRPPAPLVLK